MKEIKEFIQELCDCAKPSANGSVVALEDATLTCISCSRY